MTAATHICPQCGSGAVVQYTSGSVCSSCGWRRGPGGAQRPPPWRKKDPQAPHQERQTLEKEGLPAMPTPSRTEILIARAKPETWRDAADAVLRDLFLDRLPTDKEIHYAYPFGMRKYHPYKVWCEQVRWWKDGCPVKSHAGPVRRTQPLPGQPVLV